MALPPHLVKRLPPAMQEVIRRTEAARQKPKSVAKAKVTSRAAPSRAAPSRPRGPTRAEILKQKIIAAAKAAKAAEAKRIAEEKRLAEQKKIEERRKVDEQKRIAAKAIVGGRTGIESMMIARGGAAAQIGQHMAVAREAAKAPPKRAELPRPVVERLKRVQEAQIKRGIKPSLPVSRLIERAEAAKRRLPEPKRRVTPVIEPTPSVKRLEVKPHILEHPDITKRLPEPMERFIEKRKVVEEVTEEPTVSFVMPSDVTPFERLMISKGGTQAEFGVKAYEKRTGKKFSRELSEEPVEKIKDFVKEELDTVEKEISEDIKSTVSLEEAPPALGPIGIVPGSALEQISKTVEDIDVPAVMALEPTPTYTATIEELQKSPGFLTEDKGYTVTTPPLEPTEGSPGVVNVYKKNEGIDKLFSSTDITNAENTITNMGIVGKELTSFNINESVVIDGRTVQGKDVVYTVKDFRPEFLHGVGREQQYKDVVVPEKQLTAHEYDIYVHNLGGYLTNQSTELQKVTNTEKLKLELALIRGDATKNWHPDTEIIEYDPFIWHVDEKTGKLTKGKTEGVTEKGTTSLYIDFPYAGAEMYKFYEGKLKDPAMGFATAFTGEDPLGIASAYYMATGQPQKARDIKVKSLHHIKTLSETLSDEDKSLLEKTGAFGGWYLEMPTTQIGLAAIGGGGIGGGMGYTSKIAPTIGKIAKGGMLMVSVPIIAGEVGQIKEMVDKGEIGEALARGTTLGFAMYAGAKAFKTGYQRGQVLGQRKLLLSHVKAPYRAEFKSTFRAMEKTQRIGLSKGERVEVQRFVGLKDQPGYKMQSGDLPIKGLTQAEAKVMQRVWVDLQGKYGLQMGGSGSQYIETGGKTRIPKDIDMLVKQKRIRTPTITKTKTEAYTSLFKEYIRQGKSKELADKLTKALLKKMKTNVFERSVTIKSKSNIGNFKHELHQSLVKEFVKEGATKKMADKLTNSLMEKLDIHDRPHVGQLLRDPSYGDVAFKGRRSGILKSVMDIREQAGRKFSTFIDPQHGGRGKDVYDWFKIAEMQTKAHPFKGRGLAKEVSYLKKWSPKLYGEKGGYRFPERPGTAYFERHPMEVPHEGTLFRAYKGPGKEASVYERFLLKHTKRPTRMGDVQMLGLEKGMWEKAPETAISKLRTWWAVPEPSQWQAKITKLEGVKPISKTISSARITPKTKPSITKRPPVTESIPKTHRVDGKIVPPSAAEKRLMTKMFTKDIPIKSVSMTKAGIKVELRFIERGDGSIRIVEMKIPPSVYDDITQLSKLKGVQEQLMKKIIQGNPGREITTSFIGMEKLHAKLGFVKDSMSGDWIIPSTKISIPKVGYPIPKTVSKYPIYPSAPSYPAYPLSTKFHSYIPLKKTYPGYPIAAATYGAIPKYGDYPEPVKKPGYPLYPKPKEYPLYPTPPSEPSYPPYPESPDYPPYPTPVEEPPYPIPKKYPPYPDHPGYPGYPRKQPYTIVPPTITGRLSPVRHKIEGIKKKKKFVKDYKERKYEVPKIWGAAERRITMIKSSKTRTIKQPQFFKPITVK